MSACYIAVMFISQLSPSRKRKKFQRLLLVISISRVVDPDPHYFAKLDPDPD
jgi:hypothetical protein